jgi:hypothetical protein
MELSTSSKTGKRVFSHIEAKHFMGHVLLLSLGRRTGTPNSIPYQLVWMSTRRVRSFLVENKHWHNGYLQTIYASLSSLNFFCDFCPIESSLSLLFLEQDRGLFTSAPPTNLFLSLFKHTYCYYHFRSSHYNQQHIVYVCILHTLVP